MPPASLPLHGGPAQRKKLAAPRISLSLDQSEDDLGETPDDLDINVDDLETPEDGDYLDYTDHEMDWEGVSLGRARRAPLHPESAAAGQEVGNRFCLSQQRDRRFRVSGLNSKRLLRKRPLLCSQGYFLYCESC